ncbi:MAG TPA: prolyl oligopeptidase family serine peptidase [Chthonomonadaceae bacterium]|nr:prolyl oligopeptidase family serine peptidase [Chthonomonadaceae bacterium]
MLCFGLRGQSMRRICRRIVPWFTAAMVLSLLFGCQSQRASSAETVTAGSALSVQSRPLPALVPAQKIEPGIVVHEVSLPRGQRTSKVWIYLPEKPAAGKLPVVLIAPAGSRMFHGMALGEGDRPEHLPYVRAGFAVVAYEIDGNVGDHPDEQEILAAARAFKSAEAGLANARAALNYALAKVPNLDPTRIYTAGHSSAATTSLLVAENEPRVQACIAYAPVCNVVKFLGDRVINMFDQRIPGFGDFINRTSPDTHIQKLRCPVFLFHADDDSVVSTEEVATFAEELKKTNPNVTFVQVPTGDHYESMIQQGIPKAIAWLKSLPAKSAAR